jgi:hypothetical protein
MAGRQLIISPVTPLVLYDMTVVGVFARVGGRDSRSADTGKWSVAWRVPAVVGVARKQQHSPTRDSKGIRRTTMACFVEINISIWNVNCFRKGRRPLADCSLFLISFHLFYSPNIYIFTYKH